MVPPRPHALDRRSFLLGALASAAVAGCSTGEGEDAAETAADAARRKAASVPQPAGFVRSAWSSDPFALGAYSFLAVGAEPRLRAELAAAIDGRIFFAGEATDPDNPATVHGALASGRRVAAEVQRAAPVASSGGGAVAIVGAGAAGAQAARLLADAGWRVTVFEARDRLGGRLDTVRPTGWPLPVERGASWVHAIDDGDAAQLAQALDRLEVATVPFDYEASILGADGARLADPDGFGADARDALDDALAWAAERDTDRSVADAVVASGAADDVDPAVLRHFYDAEIATEYGADPSEISAYWGFEEGSAGDDTLVIGGYGRLPETLLEGVEVRLATAVSAIALDGDGVQLTAGDSGLRFDRVIVTVPLGVLKSEAITFDPPLPEGKRRAIERIGFGLLDKLWLRFDEQFWSDTTLMWTIVEDDGYAEWFNLAPLTGEAVLLALVGGARARRLAELSDADAVATALRSLQKLVDAGW